MSPLFLRVRKVGGLLINKLGDNGRLANIDVADVLGANPLILLILGKREDGVKQVLINFNNGVQDLLSVKLSISFKVKDIKAGLIMLNLVLNDLVILNRVLQA